jgi:hypothetical protein
MERTGLQLTYGFSLDDANRWSLLCSSLKQVDWNLLLFLLDMLYINLWVMFDPKMISINVLTCCNISGFLYFLFFLFNVWNKIQGTQVEQMTNNCWASFPFFWTWSATEVTLSMHGITGNLYVLIGRIHYVPWQTHLQCQLPIMQKINSLWYIWNTGMPES